MLLQQRKGIAKSLSVTEAVCSHSQHALALCRQASFVTASGHHKCGIKQRASKAAASESMSVF